MKPLVYTPATLPPVSGERKRYGVVGFPVAHSLSPSMQEAGFRALGIPAEYLRVEITEGSLAEALPRLRAAGFQGWNCTLPHKETMFALCDETDAKAQESASVNTVRLSNQGLYGSSTDADGWEDAVAEAWQLQLPEQRILLLGCGGVGRTLAFRLAKRGCHGLRLTNRSPGKAIRLAEELRHVAAGPVEVVPWDSPQLAKAAQESNLWIHATRLGLTDADPLPISEDLFHPSLKIYDTVYRKDLTPLIRVAQKRKIPALDGLGMLLHQGARALTFWTGQKAPLEVMRSALEKATGRKI